MAEPFALTAQPVRVSAMGFQPLYLARDISAYDQIDAVLTVCGLEGTSTPNVTVELWTGTQAQTDDGWVQLAAFTNLATANTSEKRSITSGLLRFMRWKVTTLGGTTPAAIFLINCLGRSFT